jgi:transposase-like protein
MIGYRWLDCLNDIEIFENENLEAMYNRVRTEAIRQGLLCVCDTIPVETSSETEVKPEVETKECQCPKCGNINIVETQWLNMLCMKCDYDTDNDDTVKFINGEIIKNETQEVKTSSETEVKASKWEKLNKEFDEKMSSMSDDEFSNWIDNNEVKMSVENVVEKMIESSNAIGCDIEDDIQADEIVSNTQEIVEVQVKCPSCHCRYNVYNFGDTSFKCERCGATHKLDVDGFTIIESINKIGFDIKDYKNGYIISGTTDVDLVKQKLNEFNLNRYIKIGIENQLSDISESRSVKFENPVQCFIECGCLIEALDIISQRRFIEIIQNEKVEIGDVICLLEDTVIIISEKRNCIIML